MSKRQLTVDSSQLEVSPADAAPERRSQERRMSCDPSPVRILAEGGLAPVDGYFLNVSKSGLGLCADRPLPRGMKVTVETTRLLITASVRYCLPKARGSFVVGLQIKDVAEIQ